MAYNEPGAAQRRCRRLVVREKGIVRMHDTDLEVMVLVLSPMGALIDFGRKIVLRKKEILKLSLEPADSIVRLQFKGAVVQCRDNLVGVEFVPQ